jgi:hypothetical protein
LQCCYREPHRPDLAVRYRIAKELEL